MNTLRQLLFTPWSFMRVLRLVLGLYITYEAVVNQSTLLGFLSAFFLLQAITNTGCNGSPNCAIPPKKLFTTTKDSKQKK